MDSFRVASGASVEGLGSVRPGAPCAPRRSVVAALAALLLAGLGSCGLWLLAHETLSSSSASSHRLGGSVALSRLPTALRVPLASAVVAQDPSYLVRPAGGGLQADNPSQNLRLRFARAGVEVRSGALSLRMTLAGIGSGKTLEPVAAARPSASANRVAYSRPLVGEWYRNTPLGLEQGFTIPRAPAGLARGSLTLAVAVSGNARLVLAPGGQALTLSRSGDTLRYAGIAASDARGRALPVALSLAAGGFALRIDTRGASFPVTVDPLVQQAKLTGGEEVSGNVGGRFGYSVALSADGNTALIGGMEDNTRVGAAWVFTRSGSTWTQQGPKLTGAAESGAGRFGDAVALSPDGNTALIGGPEDNAAVGAAWVFTRSGGVWTQQGPKLTASDEVGEGGGRGGGFGGSVAISSEGSTLLIGGDGDSGGAGAAWVFTRSGSTWTQQGSKLTAGGASGVRFGESVALSSEGNTALVSAPFDAVSGSVYAFSRSGTLWSQQGEKLTGTGEVGEGGFGIGLALSADGNTALVGAPKDNSLGGGHGTGAAWVFSRSGSAWSQQGEKLTGSGESGSGDFGYSAALSPDGNTALLGAYNDANNNTGAAFLFTRSGSTWTQQGAKLTGGGEIGTGGFGVSVALSAGASTALVGGASDGYEPGNGNSREIGAAWVFAAGEAPPTAPTVTKVEPNEGWGEGFTTVEITGTNFTGATAVRFGSSNARSFTVNSPTSITAVSPERGYREGSTVNVTVTTPAGTSATSAADQFTYTLGPCERNESNSYPIVTHVEPASGSPSGGTEVTITGERFFVVAHCSEGFNLKRVMFGTREATSFVKTSEATIRAIAPPGTGTVDITVEVLGTSPTGPADRFSYRGPTVTKVAPATGPPTGGTGVTITGTGFTGATSVSFGSTSAKSFQVKSATQISAVSPAGTGAVDVIVTTPEGASGKTPADVFSYGPTVTGVEPGYGPPGGGTAVTISGTGFTGATAVKFAGAKAASFTVNSASSITATAPPGKGSVDVTVTTPAGTSATGSQDRFNYGPSITKVEPSSGPSAGGTSVTITGTNLTGATEVKFGGGKARSFTVKSGTSITATSPSGKGTVDVTVTTPGGTSATGAQDRFSYTG